MRVVVVGGGVVGLSCALALAQRGCDVTVLEGEAVGAGASQGNAGWVFPALAGPVPAPGVVSQALRWLGRPTSPLYLAPRPDPALLGWLLRFARHCTAQQFRAGLEATAELARGAFAAYDALAGAGVELQEHRDGLLFAYADDADLRHHLGELELCRPYGYAPQVATGPDVGALEPSLGARVVAAALVEQERHVRPEQLCTALAEALGRAGGKVVEGTPVDAVVADASGAVREVRAAGSAWEADAVVLSTGAALAGLLRPHGVRLPVQAGKGYSVDLAPAPIALRRPLYLHGARVALSPFDGMLRVAGTMELSGINTRLVPGRAEALLVAAREYLPALEGARGRAWVGMRPMLPDGLPVIGPVAARRGLFVAGGHAMLGVTLGPVTGGLVADMVCSGVVPDVLRPFGLQRRW